MCIFRLSFPLCTPHRWWSGSQGGARALRALAGRVPAQRGRGRRSNTASFTVQEEVELPFFWGGGMVGFKKKKRTETFFFCVCVFVPFRVTLCSVLCASIHPLLVGLGARLPLTLTDDGEYDEPLECGPADEPHGGAADRVGAAQQEQGAVQREKEGLPDGVVTFSRCSSSRGGGATKNNNSKKKRLGMSHQSLRNYATFSNCDFLFGKLAIFSKYTQQYLLRKTISKIRRKKNQCDFFATFPCFGRNETIWQRWTGLAQCIVVSSLSFCLH